MDRDQNKKPGQTETNFKTNDDLSNIQNPQFLTYNPNLRRNSLRIEDKREILNRPRPLDTVEGFRDRSPIRLEFKSQLGKIKKGVWEGKVGGYGKISEKLENEKEKRLKGYHPRIRKKSQVEISDSEASVYSRLSKVSRISRISRVSRKSRMSVRSKKTSKRSRAIVRKSKQSRKSDRKRRRQKPKQLETDETENIDDIISRKVGAPKEMKPFQPETESKPVDPNNIFKNDYDTDQKENKDIFDQLKQQMEDRMLELKASVSQKSNKPAKRPSKSRDRSKKRFEHLETWEEQGKVMTLRDLKKSQRKIRRQTQNSDNESLKTEEINFSSEPQMDIGKLLMGQNENVRIDDKRVIIDDIRKEPESQTETTFGLIRRDFRERKNRREMRKSQIQEEVEKIGQIKEEEGEIEKEVLSHYEENFAEEDAQSENIFEEGNQDYIDENNEICESEKINERDSKSEDDEENYEQESIEEMEILSQESQNDITQEIEIEVEEKNPEQFSQSSKSSQLQDETIPEKSESENKEELKTKNIIKTKTNFDIKSIIEGPGFDQESEKAAIDQMSDFSDTFEDEEEERNFKEKVDQGNEILQSMDHDELLMSLKLRPTSQNQLAARGQSERNYLETEKEKKRSRKQFNQFVEHRMQVSENESDEDYIPLSDEKEEEEEIIYNENDTSNNSENFENNDFDEKEEKENVIEDSDQAITNLENKKWGQKEATAENEYELVIPLKDSQTIQQNEEEIESLQLKVTPSKKSEDRKETFSSDEEDESWSETKRQKVRRIFVKGKTEWANHSEKSAKKSPDQESNTMNQFKQKASKSSLHWKVQVSPQ